jgi:hypothetical protein
VGVGKLSTVVRGKFIQTVDDVFADLTQTATLLDEHEKMTIADYLAFGKKWGFIRTGTEDHADKEFFGDSLPYAYFPPGGGVPDALGKIGVLVSGYIQALRLAVYKNPYPKNGDPRIPRNPTLPIVSYWITEQKHFEVYASLSSTELEVHLHILTPEPSHHVQNPPAQGEDENMWAIAAEDRIKQLHDAIPLSYGAEAYFEIKGAYAQKLKSY